MGNGGGVLNFFINPEGANAGERSGSLEENMKHGWIKAINKIYEKCKQRTSTKSFEIPTKRSGVVCGDGAGAVEM